MSLSKKSKQNYYKLFELEIMACKKKHAQTDQIVKDLPVGQEGIGRHKSPHAAYSLGYYHGVIKSYE